MEAVVTQKIADVHAVVPDQTNVQPVLIRMTHTSVRDELERLLPTWGASYNTELSPFANLMIAAQLKKLPKNVELIFDNVGFAFEATASMPESAQEHFRFNGLCVTFYKRVKFENCTLKSEGVLEVTVFNGELGVDGRVKAIAAPGVTIHLNGSQTCGDIKNGSTVHINAPGAKTYLNDNANAYINAPGGIVCVGPKFQKKGIHEMVDGGIIAYCRHLDGVFDYNYFENYFEGLFVSYADWCTENKKVEELAQLGEQKLMDINSTDDDIKKGIFYLTEAAAKKYQPAKDLLLKKHDEAKKQIESADKDLIAQGLSYLMNAAALRRPLASFLLDETVRGAKTTLYIGSVADIKKAWMFLNCASEAGYELATRFLNEPYLQSRYTKAASSTSTT